MLKINEEKEKQSIEIIVINRQFWIIAILIAALAITNLAWLHEFTSYDYITTEEIVESD